MCSWDIPKCLPPPPPPLPPAAVAGILRERWGNGSLWNAGFDPLEDQTKPTEADLVCSPSKSQYQDPAKELKLIL